MTPEPEPTGPTLRAAILTLRNGACGPQQTRREEDEIAEACIVVDRWLKEQREGETASSVHTTGPRCHCGKPLVVMGGDAPGSTRWYECPEHGEFIELDTCEPTGPTESTGNPIEHGYDYDPQTRTFTGPTESGDTLSHRMIERARASFNAMPDDAAKEIRHDELRAFGMEVREIEAERDRLKAKFDLMEMSRVELYKETQELDQEVRRLKAELDFANMAINGWKESDAKLRAELEEMKEGKQAVWDGYEAMKWAREKAEAELEEREKRNRCTCAASRCLHEKWCPSLLSKEPTNG